MCKIKPKYVARPFVTSVKLDFLSYIIDRQIDIFINTKMNYRHIDRKKLNITKRLFVQLSKNNESKHYKDTYKEKTCSDEVTTINIKIKCN